MSTTPPPSAQAGEHTEPDHSTPSAPATPPPSPPDPELPTAAATPIVATRDIAREYPRQAEIEAIAPAFLAPGHHVIQGVCLPEPEIAARGIATARVRKSLTVVNSHGIARHVAGAMVSHGLDAAAFPQMNNDTCTVWHDGPESAAATGLPVASLFCPSCPHRNGPNTCAFIKQRHAAECAPHLVLTSHRASVNPADSVGNRDAVVFVHSHPADTLHPVRSVAVGDNDDRSSDPAWESESLRLLHAAADTIIWASEELADRSVHLDAFWPWVQRIAIDVNAALQAGCVREISLSGRSEPATEKPFSERVRELWAILQDAPDKPLGDITRAVMAAAAGELEQLAFCSAGSLDVGSTAHRPARVTPGGHLLEVRPLARLPEGVSAVAVGEHATDVLSGTTGVTWRIFSAACEGDIWARVTQLFRRVTASSRPRKLLDRVRLLLRQYPGRVGILAHHNLLAALTRRMGDEAWPQADRDRISTAKWFSEDTRSLVGCDVILGLGAPRPHRLAVFKRLLQARDPAAYREPHWGPNTWESVSPGRERLLLAGHGYADHAWRAADAEIVRGVLRRWLGSTSCPVIIVSDDRLDVPLGGENCEGLSAHCQMILDTLTHGLATTPVATPTAVVPAPVVPTRRLAELLGVSERTVRYRLTRLVELKLVTQVNKFAGWRPLGEPDFGAVTEECRETLATLQAEVRAIADSRRMASKMSISESAVKSSKGITSIEETDAIRGESAITVEQISERTGLPCAAIRKHLQRLAELGFVTQAATKGHKGATRWTLMRFVNPQAVEDDAAVAPHAEAVRIGRLVQPELPFGVLEYAATLEGDDRPPDLL